MATKIEWVKNRDGSQGLTWNPVTGCTKISPGCQNCYAERMAKRLRGRCGYPADDPFRVTLHPERLEEPLRWRKPSKIFVCSMGDLFHEAVPDDFIHRVFATIGQCPQHTFIILTKRPKRMKAFIEDYYACESPSGNEQGLHIQPNVWLGVTTENQEMADRRIPILLQIPAAVRFISVEPMLGDINIAGYLGWNGLRRMGDGLLYRWVAPKIDWIICGGETGPDARPMHPDWVRSLRDQCQSAGVPFYFKSWGEWVCRPWSSDNGRKRELCLGMDGTSVYAQVGHMMGFRKPGEALMVRVGKKAAGRLLDGRTWEEMPGVRL